MSNEEETKNEEKPPEEEEKVSEERTARVCGLPVDWTQLGGDPKNSAPAIWYPSDSIEIDPEDKEFICVGTAGRKITNIGPEFYKEIHPETTQLVMRSHLIRKMEGFQGLQCLETLELYDNQVDALQCLDEGEDGAPGRTIRILDMSYNVIRDMQPVEVCPNLQELYLANNKVKSLAGLKGLKFLRKADLGANRIRVMDVDELSGLVNLEELWLGKNKIEKIEGLEALTKLRRLDIQSNRITVVENLTTQAPNLEELYLASNGIDDEGASHATGLALEFPNLSVLDLNRNRLTSTDPLVHLKSLDELWISGNNIASFDDVQSLTELGGTLDTIYLEYNDLQKDPLYRKKLKELMPALKQIDADLVGGLAAHGIPTPNVGNLIAETEEERNRRLQEMVVQRAQAETQGASQNENKE